MGFHFTVFVFICRVIVFEFPDAADSVRHGIEIFNPFDPETTADSII
jgi:hypothetical protein